MKVLERQPAENARTYAIRVLLYNIISLELLPGSAISENELSAVMNLSRTPVREALIELSKMSLVQIFPKRSSYVSKIDYDLIEESRFIRLVLENAVLKLVCCDISPRFLSKLKANLELQEMAGETLNADKLFELDNEFHRLLFESAGKNRTYEIIHSQMVHFDRLRTLSLKTVKQAKTIEDHKNIVHAVELHDSELAEFLITRHLTRHQVEKSELISLYPDYFVH